MALETLLRIREDQRHVARQGASRRDLDARIQHLKSFAKLFVFDDDERAVVSRHPNRELDAEAGIHVRDALRVVLDGLLPQLSIPVLIAVVDMVFHVPRGGIVLVAVAMLCRITMLL